MNILGVKFIFPVIGIVTFRTAINYLPMNKRLMIKCHWGNEEQ